MLSLTDRNYKNSIPPPRCFPVPNRNRRMGYGIPLTHQNVRWSQFFADFLDELPEEQRTEDYIELGPLAADAADLMEGKARRLWRPSKLYISTTGGYILALADNTGRSPTIPPPEVVAQIQKEITLEDDAVVGWYTLRG